MPVAPAYPEEAFVVEADGARTAGAEIVTAALDFEPPESRATAETPTGPDVVALEDEGAASERMAPFPRTDSAEDGPLVLLAPPASPLEADSKTEAEAEGEAAVEIATEIRTDPADTPSFVRQAEREARWRQPRVRAALALGCFAATLLLGAQWMLAQRDLVAARSPALKPALAAACGAFGCEVQAPHALEALRVESSGVVRVEKSDLYRLSVSLRNLRTHEVALPAFELALTDTQGQLIARRVLRAGELGARVGSLAAGAELALQCTIQVAAGTVAGYTIELFYP
jgi:hypothetical protein